MKKKKKLFAIENFWMNDMKSKFMRTRYYVYMAVFGFVVIYNHAIRPEQSNYIAYQTILASIFQLGFTYAPRQTDTA